MNVCSYLATDTNAYTNTKSPEVTLGAPVPAVIIKYQQVNLGGNRYLEINKRKYYINKSTMASKIISTHSEIPMYESVFKCVPLLKKKNRQFVVTKLG